MSDRTAPEKYSPLHQLHVDGGASFTDFAGWQMPVSYGSDLVEHHAVRTAAGIFDISHMAEIVVNGADAAAFLDFALAGKISAVSIGQAKYSLLLAAGGGIIDDLVVYRLGETTYFVVANAGNRAPVVAALHERSEGFAVEVVDASDDYALIAVQGPASRAILEATPGITVGKTPLSELKYYWSTEARFDGTPLIIGRTGYTGEDGFELYIDVAHAATLWRALTAVGVPSIMAGGSFADMALLQAFLGGNYHGPDDELTDATPLGGAADDADLHVALVDYFANVTTWPGR